MTKTFLKVTIFSLILIGLFVYIGDALTRISGISGGGGTAVGVNPEAGENIFWGKGKCGTCHSIGGRGSAVRCPNLEDIGAKAAERATQRGLTSPTEFLVESIADPSAYVVKGFKDEMPLVYQPPIALSPDEIKAVISYMQSIGGEVDVASIKLPDVIKEASAQVVPWEPYMAGDPEAGEYIFFDPESNAACAKCHIAESSSGEVRGGAVGPELTDIAGTRTPQFILQSILDPSAEIASGFESILVITTDGRYLTGVFKGEDESSIQLMDKDGRLQTIPKSNVRRKTLQKTSIMPGNFSEILTLKDFHDIMSYMLTLK